MSIAVSVVSFLLFFFCGGSFPCCAQNEMIAAQGQIKTYDVNNDGTSDVTYYGDGKYVQTVEADTNYDKKPDVVVHIKDGQFESAEVDTDHNGTMDKKISDVKTFNQWLNENSPDFEDYLNRPNWQFDLKKF